MVCVIKLKAPFVTQFPTRSRHIYKTHMEHKWEANNIACCSICRSLFWSALYAERIKSSVDEYAIINCNQWPLSPPPTLAPTRIGSLERRPFQIRRGRSRDRQTCGKAILQTCGALVVAVLEADGGGGDGRWQKPLRLMCMLNNLQIPTRALNHSPDRPRELIAGE